MDALSTLEVRAGEIRIRLSELGGQSDVTEETRAELDTLRTEYADTERRMAALRISEAPITPLETRSSEGKGYRDMVAKANVGEIFHAAIHGGVTSGATAELQAHHKLESRSVPLSLMIGRWPTERELEERAVAAPGEVQQNAQPTLAYVFPDSVGVFLGIDMPSVPTGDAVFPILTTAPGVETPAEGVAVTEATGTITADVLTPKRVSAWYSYTREDRARFAEMDSALRESLTDGLTSELDKELLVGTGGLLAGTNLANHNASAVTTYALYRSQFAYARVDGRYASMVSDLRAVMGAETYAHAASLYRGNNDNTDALGSLMSATGGIRVSAHVPFASSKQEAVIRLGMRRDMIQCVWDGISIIPDEVTSAAAGKINITAIALFNQKILRTDGFYKQQTQHA